MKTNDVLRQRKNGRLKFNDLANLFNSLLILSQVKFKFIDLQKGVQKHITLTDVFDIL